MSVDIQGHMFGNITHVKLTNVKLISKYSAAVKFTQEHMTHVNILQLTNSIVDTLLEIINVPHYLPTSVGRRGP